ncbi:hypothetical protein KXD40_008950 [Peronospora effusa]|nr:hypothetical protein KXD40_008950 [Peronospora effusa]
MHPPGPHLARVPDTRQRKLGIRPKHFVRHIQFAERASDTPSAEDVKVDNIWGHHLSGMAERYYNRQMDGWWEEQPTLENAMQL